jgi:DNA-binding beta-propeller fold protein YncE
MIHLKQRFLIYVFLLIGPLCADKLYATVNSADLFAYVANMQGELFKINVETLKITTSTSLTDMWMTSTVGISPDGKYVYVVGNVFPGMSKYPLEKLDAATLKVVAKSSLGFSLPVNDPVGIGYANMAISPNGEKMFLADNDSNNILILNASDLEIVGKLKGSFSTGGDQKQIAFSSDGGVAYIRTNGLMRVDVKSNKEIPTKEKMKVNLNAKRRDILAGTTQINLSDLNGEKTEHPVLLDKYGVFCKSDKQRTVFEQSYTKDGKLKAAPILKIIDSGSQSISTVTIPVEKVAELGDAIYKKFYSGIKLGQDKKDMVSSLGIKEPAVTPDGKRVFVPLSGGNGYKSISSYILVLEVATQKVIGTIEIPNTPTNVVFGYEK